MLSAINAEPVTGGVQLDLEWNAGKEVDSKRQIYFVKVVVLIRTRSVARIETEDTAA